MPLSLRTHDPRAERALAEARRIVVDGLRDTPARVYLFGSRARGMAHSGSDIDVAVLPLTALRPGVLSRIREGLEESRIPYRVDLVDLSTTTPEFRARIIGEGIPWSG
jgi:predicted nucleotidyltransferase